MEGDKAVPVNGVCEIALEQNDLAAAEAFYADVLGFPVVERWSGQGEAYGPGRNPHSGLRQDPEIRLG